jgi:hypothetical protein
VAIILALTHASYAQLVAGPGVTDASSSQPTSNRTFSFSGTIPGQLDGALSVTFSIYPDQQSTTALWTETQVVQVTGEKYSVMLGSTVTTGLPPEIFSADQAHWLGVQVNGSEKRFLLVSVPYAMKAVEAERLGGLLPTDFVTVQQLQSALQSVVAPGTSTQPKATSTGPTGQAAAAGTPPQPATDFTDNNTSEVLLVTQQGTGYAVHAITSSQAEAILAQNDSIGGTALHAFATNATGTSIGVLAETTSPNGIAGVFNNRTGGKILSLRNNGVEVASADVNGNLTASGQVQATTFSGGGFGLFGIPQSAINATPFNNPSSVVARDSNGSFAANQVAATTFSGGGFGLFGIPQSAINATPFNNPSSVVARDSNGSFAANQVTATTFSGGGFGLFGIPQSAINATPFNNPFSVVARDQNGSFAANQVTATTFSGGGFGLFGIPQSAINATPFNNPFSVVARDQNGSFAANQVTATTFSGGGFGLFGIPQSAINATPLNDAFSVVARDQNGSFAANQITATTFSGGNLQVMNQLTSSGFVDFSGAVTAPVRTVLTANIPPLCFTSKELLLVTDAVPGQQLFVCNSNGNGWVLLGDGGGSAGSSNVSGNTTGTLENVSQLGSGTALTVSSTSGTAVSASSTSGMAIHGDSTGVGVQGSSQGGIGVWAAATANDSTGTALLLSHASQGKLIDGGVSLGSGTDIFETFSVTAEGDVTFNGAMMTPYETTGTWFASSLVKLTSIPGNFGAGTVAMTSPGDTSGVIGIISGLPASGSRIQVVQSGQFFCNFDGPATSGHYVGISKTTAGDCTDIGASYPTDGQQVVGRVLSSFVTGTGRVLLFQSELHGGAGGAGNAITINTGAGLTGGPITGSGTISIANSGVTNAMLQNSSVTITPGPGLAGGGPVSLGGTVTLSNTGVLSLNGRVGSVTSATGDYSFAQISGSAAVSQLPATVAYSNQANTFTGNQTVNGSVTASSFSGSGSTLTGVNAATLNGFASGSFAQVAAANTFAAKQTLAASTTASASLNVPAGSGPSSPVAGDLWNTGSTVQYRDNASTTRSLVSTTQSGGLQLLKLTASITPASVASQGCTEQSFTVSGISSGDVLLSVLQPSTSSPGANIAIGGFRVSAANTVAVQFCNVSRNNSTPTAGVYTFAFMR